jgi:hypothetical protein
MFDRVRDVFGNQRRADALGLEATGLFVECADVYPLAIA